MKRKYDVAAFVWPSYTGDELRTRIFWPEGMGEWQTVRDAVPKFDGHQWPRKPVWGYVNEADSRVMEMQIDVAADHGVNVFIYDWYWYDGRPFLENCLNDGYLKAENNHKVKFYLMWANHDVGYSWDIRNSDMEGNYTLEQRAESMLYTGAVNRTEFEKIALRMIEKYFKHPNYYTIDGKPVLMIFTLPVLIKGLGGVAETKAALEWFKDKCVQAGLPGLHLQLNQHQVCYEIYDGDRLMPIAEVINYLGFDSTTNYQMVNLIDSGTRDYGHAVQQAIQGWEKCDFDSPVPYFPQVGVGWDNNPRFKKPVEFILSDNTPEKFKAALASAKDFLDKRPDRHPLITINSWNEWTEGSYLEPDDIYGYGYLEAVKRVFVDEEETEEKTGKLRI